MKLKIAAVIAALNKIEESQGGLIDLVVRENALTGKDNNTLTKITLEPSGEGDNPHELVCVLHVDMDSYWGTRGDTPV